MTDEQIYDTLTPLFRDVFDDDEIVLTPTLSAADVDGWDSLSHIRMVLAVERAFKTSFPASRVASLKNVGDLVALIGKST